MTRSEPELDAFAAWERAAWELKAVPYASAIGELTRGSVAALLDAAQVGPGTRVLDVGTGPGYVALAAAQRGAMTSGCDRSAAMVAIARAAGVDAVVGAVEDLPYGDAAFDAVVAGYVLHHLPRPERALASLARVLRPGGRVALTVWDLPEANPALGLFSPVTAEAGLASAAPPGPDAARFARGEAMADVLRESFRDVTVTRVRWSLTVEPGEWFDVVATSMPRTGAVLASATPEQRPHLRDRYVELARQRFGRADGRVELPASAVLGAARR